MAQHRTKQEKQEAQIRREEKLNYSLNDISKNDSKPASLAEALKSKSKVKDKPESTIVNQQFLRKDLIHTAVSTLVVLGILLVTWQVLR